ncbi:MAG: PSD1 and planctomycete cytochrome C domain-containing protein [Bryobacterales bacterium]|nr:PSD1 and planctomycete cytochrome C domain-containing protein [Bryobacterales bacterium]
MTFRRRHSWAILTVTLSAVATAAAATQDEAEFFERNIRPVLVEKCSACHGEQLQTAGLNLATAAGFLKGGESGPVFLPGDPEGSPLLDAIRYEGPIKMPPTGRLAAEEIDALLTWFKLGAPWPDAGAGPAEPVSGQDAQWNDEQLRHWAFQPVRPHRPPVVGDGSWTRTPIDRFILAKLEERGIAPPRRADRLTLLRRAKYDLHGLAPTEAEIREYLSDKAPGAFERLVDRLLGSPRYGEKWGRHWLDVVRYADSTGLDDDIKVPNTWRYRDYVIDALNRDTPFDQFVLEQIAGDLLPAKDPDGVNRRGIVGTGFLAVGTKPLVQQDKIKMKYDVIDEQIDTTAKAFMGLTMGCARCHDHKFDPISAKDYYSMAAIFGSVRNFESLDPAMTVSKVHLEPLVPRETYRKYRDHQASIRNVKRRIESLVDVEMYRYVMKHRGPQLSRYMLAAFEVYDSGADAEMVGARERLDCEVLRLWAAYLKPGDDLRLHLSQWHEAAGEDRRSVAEEYQQRFHSRAEEWIARLEEWRREIDAWDGDGEFPEKPDLAPGSDRFFSEVTLEAGSMDEGADAADGPFSISEDALDAVLPSEKRERVEKLRRLVSELEESMPPEPPMAYAVAQGEGVPQHVFIRGSHNNPGPRVDKGFPEILAGEDQAPISSVSGRRELGEWLGSPNHPLTGRVIVNRIWQWHFGQGLVRTPNNFGLMGDRPTHPELLDYLAARFVNEGWSMKAMHRLIMLSGAYQMQSRVSDEAWTKDPSNHTWSRFNRRRLSVEEMRDSLLAVDGSIDLAMGGALTESLDSYGFSNAYVHPDETRRRTVYLPIYRNKMPTMLTLFDFADPSASIAVRPRTSIAPQGLYFMNSGFVHERAKALAGRLLRDGKLGKDRRVRQAYRIALSREPDATEVDEALDYMAEFPVRGDEADDRFQRWQSFCRLLLGSNEFNYIN